MKRTTIKEFVEKARSIHGKEYEYSNVNYINARTKVCIIHDKCGKEFFQKPNTHLNGCGCPYCYGTKALTTEEFIKKAKEVHGIKYDYSKSNYIGAKKKICIICPVHGEFLQIACEHLKGHGCPDCGRKKIALQETFTKEEFIKRSNEIHNGKYDYSDVEYCNNKIKIKINCPIHGYFWQKPYLHLQGCGCPKCGIKTSKEEENLYKAIKEKETSSVLKRVTNVIPPYELDIYIPGKKLQLNIMA